MKKVILSIVFITGIFISGLFIAVPGSYALNLEASLYANGESVAGRLGYIEKKTYGFMQAGIEATYKSDEFKLGSVDFGVRSDDFIPGLRYKLGFKGVYFDLDEEENKDYETSLKSLCFVIGIEHDLSTKINPLAIPISFGAELSISPEPLTWGEDAKSYFDARGNIKFHILSNASVILEYRYLNAGFKNEKHNWDKKDNNLLFGFNIIF